MFGIKKIDSTKLKAKAKVKGTRYWRMVKEIATFTTLLTLSVGMYILAGLSFSVGFSNSAVDSSAVNWTLFGSLFVVFATIALIASVVLLLATIYDHKIYALKYNKEAKEDRADLATLKAEAAAKEAEKKRKEAQTFNELNKPTK